MSKSPTGIVGLRFCGIGQQWAASEQTRAQYRIHKRASHSVVGESASPLPRRHGRIGTMPIEDTREGPNEGQHVGVQ